MVIGLEQKREVAHRVRLATFGRLAHAGEARRALAARDQEQGIAMQEMRILRVTQALGDGGVREVLATAHRELIGVGAPREPVIGVRVHGALPQRHLVSPRRLRVYRAQRRGERERGGQRDAKPRARDRHDAGGERERDRERAEQHVAIGDEHLHHG